MMPYGFKRKCRYVYLDEPGSGNDWHKMKRGERRAAKRDIAQEVAEIKSEEKISARDKYIAWVTQRSAVRTKLLDKTDSLYKWISILKALREE